MTKLTQLAADCEVARTAYDKARRKHEYTQVSKASDALVAAWIAWDKAHK